MSSSLPGRSLRFTISRHEKPGEPHFDLFLEPARGDALTTFTTAAAPHQAAVGEALPARRIADHRRAYLDFEGEVSGGRGTVRIVEAGTYRVVEDSPEGRTLEMQGRTFSGVFVLQRAQGEGWTMTRRQ
jgi:hypothetical protein